MRNLLLCFSLISIALMDLAAQDQKILDDLSFYSDVMLNATNYSHRLRANEAFKENITQFLNMKGSFEMEIEKIEYIKTVMPPDSSFKIITFNVADEAGTTSDYGYIQKSDGNFFELQPTKNSEDIEYETLDAKNWLSGLYYHIIPFTYQEKEFFMLFGFSQPKPNEKRKTIEIFHWDEGKPVFGAELLVEEIEGSRDIRKQRAVYYYSSDVSMSIRDDDEFEAIVIDHLMAVRSRIPGFSGNVNVPDGTYTAYHLKNGEWIYKDRLFEEKDVQKVEDKPADIKKKDLFGKTRKN